MKYLKTLGLILFSVLFIVMCSCSGLQKVDGPAISPEAAQVKHEVETYDTGSSCKVKLLREPVDVFVQGAHFIFLFADNNCDGKCDVAAVIQSLGKVNGKFEFAMMWVGDCAEGEKILSEAKAAQKKTSGIKGVQWNTGSLSISTGQSLIHALSL